jgi:4-oxalocrotonate tautomerase family enzyme
MPIITIEGPPRDKETKRKLVKGLTAVFKEVYGYPEDFEHVTVIIRENSPENVGANGELLIDIWKK